MNELKEIIPWTCHICTSQFHEAQGGLCRRCKKIVCNRHLKHIVVKGGSVDREGDRLVCESCLKEGEKTETVAKWKWKTRLSRLRR